MKVPWRIHAIISALVLYVLCVHAASRHRNPLTYLSLVENPEIRTPSQRVHAFSKFDVTFALHQRQQQIKLVLEPNHGIITEGLVVTYLDQDGKVDRTQPIDRHEYKLFKGDAWIQNPDGSWVTAGWVRIMLRRDGAEPLFEGAFSIGRDHHHILLRSNYMKTKHNLDPGLEDRGDEYMVIYRDSDILPDETEGHMELKRSREGQSSCSSDQLLFNTDLSHPVFSSISKRETGFWGSSPLVHLFGKRQIDTPGIPGGGNGAGVNLKETIGDTTGCPTTRKVALVGVATDCGYTASFNSDDDVNKNIIKQFATASSLYEESFNITLGLAHITLSPRSCPSTPPQDAPWNTGCGGNMSITDRLNTFSQWRSERNDSNAYWSLLTSCPTGPEVGLSWLGQLCVNDVTKGTGEVVSGANVVAKTSNEWQVIAHESGHTFGAVHDCDSSACSDQNSVSAQQCCPLTANTCDAGEQYIMNPSTGQGISKFSRCTLGNVCSAIQRNSVKTTCLSDNRNVPTLQGHQCGNGIVEEGEQCDCGGRENCGGNNCCDPDTCRFRSGAVCDGSNEDCCNNCQYSQAGTVCRPSTGECDPQETCSGNNATCPTDVSSPDGQRCGNSSAGLECASGQCTSRDQQCKTLMGSYTANNDTYACNKQDCTLSCASPEFGMGVCYSMQQNFLDGTSCGGGGRCQNGQCKGSNFGKEVGSWIHDHRNLVIGIACGLGGLVLLAILSCCIQRCRRPKRVRVRSPPMQQSWAGGPMPQGNGWNGWQQHPSPMPPPMPPPIPPQYMQPSVRYA